MTSASPPVPAIPLMSLEAFQDFLDRFGENPAAWPEAQRAGVQALLDTVPAARRAFDDAVAIHEQLRRRPVKAPASLLHAIDRSVSSERVSREIAQTDRPRAAAVNGRG